MRWMIMPLRRYADFRGRSRQAEFWIWMLFLLLVIPVLVALDVVLGLGGHNPFDRMANYTVFTMLIAILTSGGLLTWIFLLAVLIPHCAVQVRRMHDSDRTGWWILLPIAPFVFTFALALIAVASRSITMALITGLSWLLSFGGIVWLIVLLCLDGTRGVNRFGLDPRDPDGATDLAEVFD